MFKVAICDAGKNAIKVIYYERYYKKNQEKIFPS